MGLVAETTKQFTRKGRSFRVGTDKAEMSNAFSLPLFVANPTYSKVRRYRVAVSASNVSRESTAYAGPSKFRRG